MGFMHYPHIYLESDHKNLCRRQNVLRRSQSNFGNKMIKSRYIIYFLLKFWSYQFCGAIENLVIEQKHRNAPR